MIWQCPGLLCFLDPHSPFRMLYVFFFWNPQAPKDISQWFMQSNSPPCSIKQNNNWLVVSTYSEKWGTSSLGMMKFPIMENKSHVWNHQPVYIYTLLYILVDYPFIYHTYIYIYHINLPSYTNRYQPPSFPLGGSPAAPISAQGTHGNGSLGGTESRTASSGDWNWTTGTPHDMMMTTSESEKKKKRVKLAEISEIFSHMCPTKNKNQ